MKKLRSRILMSMLACMGMLMLVSTNAFAASTSKEATPSHSITAPISGTISNGKIFTGTFTVTRFVTRNQTLLAVGTIQGVITNAPGKIAANAVNQQQVSIPAALPVASAVASCSILALTLGPLDLNLLGLYIHLNQVVLNITAIPGAGGLLGNLLCSVAGLLDGGTPLTGLVALLNQILAAL